MSGKALILDAISARPRSVAEIVTATGLKRKTVSNYMLELRAETPRRLHITYWETAQRPVYAPGDGVDAPPKRKKSKKRHNQCYWNRVKRDPARHMAKIMRDRAYKFRRANKPATCDPLVALFFGR